MFSHYIVPLCVVEKKLFILIILEQLQTIVTGAGDETLRFWNIFPSMKAPVSNVTNFNYGLS